MTIEAEPQAGDATTPQPQAGTPSTEPQAGESQTISLEEAKKLRSEAQNLRKRMKAYEDAERQVQEAQLSETERLKKQHSDLQAQHDTYTRQMQERIVRYEVERQATQLGIIDPDAAVRLLDWSELEYDEQGTPTNTEKLLQALIKKRTYLAPSAQQETPARVGAPVIPAMNPGRSTLSAPNSLPPGKHMTLKDVPWSR
jgi:hypothetical protein